MLGLLVAGCHRELAALAQMVACLPPIQKDWGSIPSRVLNFHLKIFNLRARRSRDVKLTLSNR